MYSAVWMLQQPASSFTGEVSLRRSASFLLHPSAAVAAAEIGMSTGHALFWSAKTRLTGRYTKEGLKGIATWPCPEMAQSWLETGKATAILW
ncbi:hypothetical protein MUK42_30640 [Musa troglodytarum]|uniref:Uncharacterized protein n=1 Tax=Musa troglodytarum TaxID=320322 RepID=A0A9E7K1H8_9LILI|nr:hypothetical protein MUK42_30640 [Musa troglodytarum]